MRFIFVTNQFKTGGVETVFYNIASTTNKPLDLLPVHQNYDDNLIKRLPDNVNLIQSGINPDRTKIGFLSILKNAYKIKKELNKDEYIAINFSDTLSSLITAYILSGQNTISWMHISPSFLTKSKAYKLYVTLLRKCSRLIFICHDQKKLFFNIIGHDIPTNKVEVCSNIVDLQLIDRLKEEEINYEKPYFLMVARMDERSKDHYTLLRAFSQLPDKIKDKYRLLLAGDGPDLEKVIECARDEGIIDKVVFLGNVDNPYKWMYNSTLYIHSSRTEGYALVLVEALACGCTIISSDCPVGPSEILDKGKYGTLFSPGDHLQLRDYIVNAIDKCEFTKGIYRRRAEKLTEIGIKQIRELFNGYEKK